MNKIDPTIMKDTVFENNNNHNLKQSPFAFRVYDLENN